MNKKNHLKHVIQNYLLLFTVILWTATAISFVTIYDANYRIKDLYDELDKVMDGFSDMSSIYSRAVSDLDKAAAVEIPDKHLSDYSQLIDQAIFRLTAVSEIPEYDQLKERAETLGRHLLFLLENRSDPSLHSADARAELETEFLTLQSMSVPVTRSISQIQVEKIGKIRDGQEIMIILCITTITILSVLLFHKAEGIINKFIGPIESLSSQMSNFTLRPASGKLQQETLHTQATDRETEIIEISELQSAFSFLKRHIDEDLRQIQEQHEHQNHLNRISMEKLEVEFELEKYKVRVLKSQINPHFLYNTLNVIASTAYLNQDEDVHKMILHLSKLLRYSTSTDLGGDYSTLAGEIENVKDYLFLRNAGRKIKMDLNIDCGEEELRVVLPRLTLQPIIENAINHGQLAAIANPLIRISAQRENQMFTLLVANNGKAFDSEIKEKINKGVYFQEGDHSIGLSSVYYRLRSIYREYFSLKVDESDSMVAIRMLMNLGERTNRCRTEF